MKVRVYTQLESKGIAPSRAHTVEAWLAIAGRIYLKRASSRAPPPQTLYDFRASFQLQIDDIRHRGDNATLEEVEGRIPKSSCNEVHALTLAVRRTPIWIPSVRLFPLICCQRNELQLVIISETEEERDHIQKQLRNRLLSWEVCFRRMMHLTPFETDQLTDILIDMSHVLLGNENRETEELDVQAQDFRLLFSKECLDTFEFFLKWMLTTGLVVIAFAITFRWHTRNFQIDSVRTEAINAVVTTSQLVGGIFLVTQLIIIGMKFMYMITDAQTGILQFPKLTTQIRKLQREVVQSICEALQGTVKARPSLIEHMFEVRADCMTSISKMECFLTSSTSMRFWNSSGVEGILKEVKNLKVKVGVVNLTAALMKGRHDRFELQEVIELYREMREG